MVLPLYNPREVFVLVVDDSPEDVLIISRALNRAGFDNAIVCQRGEDAIDWIANNPTNLMILEYHLPAMNGIQVLEQLTTMNLYVPTIAVSRQADLRTAVAFMKQGAADFLAKDDYLSSALVRSVNAILRQHGAAEERQEARLLDSGTDKLTVAITEAQWLLKAYKSPFGSRLPQPGNRDDLVGAWGDVVDAVKTFVEMSVRVFPEIVSRDEDRLIRMLVQRGLSPRDTVTLYQLALYSLKRGESSEAVEVRVNPGVILARILARLTEEYQRSLSEGWAKVISQPRAEQTDATCDEDEPSTSKTA